MYFDFDYHQFSSKICILSSAKSNAQFVQVEKVKFNFWYRRVDSEIKRKLLERAKEKPLTRGWNEFLVNETVFLEWQEEAVNEACRMLGFLPEDDNAEQIHYPQIRTLIDKRKCNAISEKEYERQLYHICVHFRNSIFTEEFQLVLIQEPYWFKRDENKEYELLKLARNRIINVMGYQPNWGACYMAEMMYKSQYSPDHEFTDPDFKIGLTSIDSYAFQTIKFAETAQKQSLRVAMQLPLPYAPQQFDNPVPDLGTRVSANFQDCESLPLMHPYYRFSLGSKSCSAPLNIL